MHVAWQTAVVTIEASPPYPRYQVSVPLASMASDLFGFVSPRTSSSHKVCRGVALTQQQPIPFVHSGRVVGSLQRPTALRSCEAVPRTVLRSLQSKSSSTATYLSEFWPGGMHHRVIGVEASLSLRHKDREPYAQVSRHEDIRTWLQACSANLQGLESQFSR